jgi:hypothetical protein
MESGLRRRKSEYQPAMTGIDGVETEDVPEEDAVGLGIFAVDDEMSARNHGHLRRQAWSRRPTR